MVTTPEIAQTLAQRLHFNTYGGNPVCCAGGRAVLQAVDEDGIQANAAKVGSSSQMSSSPFGTLEAWSVACTSCSRVAFISTKPGREATKDTEAILCKDVQVRAFRPMLPWSYFLESNVLSEACVAQVGCQAPEECPL